MSNENNILPDAAPELYEALTKAIRFVKSARDIQMDMGEGSRSSYLHYNNIVKLCENALAKARGEKKGE